MNVKALEKAEERLGLFANALLAFRFNATQAAISIGVPPRGASTFASKALRNPKFQSLLTDKLEALKHKHDLTIDKIVMELKAIGFANLADYTRLTPDGLRVIDMSTATREQMAAVAELNVEEDVLAGKGARHSDDADENDSANVLRRRTKIKFHDKKGALVDLLKFLQGNLGKMDGAVVNDNSVTNLTQNNVNITVKEAEEAYRKMIDGK